MIVKELDASRKAVKIISPDEVVREAIDKGCLGIAFLMNDPLASFQTFVTVAKKAKEQGLLVGCASNAYFTTESLNRLSPILDFIHIGFKGCSEACYVECGASSIEPVLRNLRTLYNEGVHVEASCIHKKGCDHEVMELAGHVGMISGDIPFHVMRFVPLEASSPDLEPSIKESEALCESLKTILKHVYLFNSPGTEFLSTICPSCKQLVFKREFYGPMGAKLKMDGPGLDVGGRCPSCDTEIGIRGEVASSAFQEEMFEGGYPFTRALEILESILIAIGVTRRSEIVDAWDCLLGSRMFQRLHKEIQAPDSFLGLVSDIGRLAGRSEKAKELIAYLKERLDFISKKVSKATKRPKVYYAMGKPWFSINGDRMENSLVEFAGGESLNRRVQGKGRPGTEISPALLNHLNPEVIFISSMFDSPIEDFYSECREAGIDVDATRDARIYRHPIPVSDFGSPRWILGLMRIANVLHPVLFEFDVIGEAKLFYDRFYQAEYDEGQVNLSFGKPLKSWVFK